MGIIDDMGKQSRLQADRLGNEVNEYGILRHIERYSQSHIAAALHQHAVEPSVADIPQRLEGAGLQCHIRQVFYIPQRDNHPPVHIQQMVHLLVFSYLISIGFSDGAIRAHPFIPDMAVHLLQFPYIIALKLPDPEDFLDGCFKRNELGSQNRKFLFQVELKYLVRKFIRRYSRAVIGIISLF